MSSGRQVFNIARAHHNRITEATRQGYVSCINQIKVWLRLVNKQYMFKRCSQSKDGQTSNIRCFKYDDLLEFLEWTVRNKDLEVGTRSGYCSAIKSLYKDQRVQLPEGYGDEMKELFSGINKICNIRI